MNLRLASLTLILVTTVPICSQSIAEDPAGRVLVIGIDGLRPDALNAARTPAIDSLIDNGCFSESTKILGERYRKNDTVSGPGWSSFLTGVWADKHGVDNNQFTVKHYDRYPAFFCTHQRSESESVNRFTRRLAPDRSPYRARCGPSICISGVRCRRIHRDGFKSR